jgi:hypothetical protein
MNPPILKKALTYHPIKILMKYWRIDWLSCTIQSIKPTNEVKMLKCFHCGQPCSGDTTESIKTSNEKGPVWKILPICDNPELCPDNIFTETANILHEQIFNDEDKSFVSMKIANFILLLAHEKGWNDKETAHQLHFHFYGN